MSAVTELPPNVRDIYPAAIGGRDELGRGTRMPLVDPRTGAEFSSAVRCGAHEIDLAVAAAKQAFETWRATPALERGRVLVTLARRIREEADLLAGLESLNTGRRLTECRGEIETAAQFFEFYGGLAPGIEGAVIEPSAHGRFTYQVVEPYG